MTTLALPDSDTRRLLPVADAITATMATSRRSFYRWAQRNNVKAFRRGRYLRADLAAALAGEGKQGGGLSAFISKWRNRR